MARGTKIKPTDVAAAYGEEVTPEEIAAEIAECKQHEPADHKKATMQTLYGGKVVCKYCGAEIHLEWITSD